MIVSGVDEDAITRATSAPSSSQALADAQGARRSRHGVAGDALVLGCDSLLEFDGAAARQARRRRGRPSQRWQTMRGRTGMLHTGHCLLDAAHGRSVDRACVDRRCTSPT